MSNNTNTMDWDSPITTDGDRRETPPQGEYAFKITGFKRGTFQPRQGSAGKIKTSCPQAELALEIAGRDKQVFTVEARVILHESCVGLLSAFARAIGQRKHGDAETIMRWNEVPGAEGFCKITHRTYLGGDGASKVAHDVKFCDPGETQLSKDIAAGSVEHPLCPF